MKKTQRSFRRTIVVILLFVTLLSLGFTQLQAASEATVFTDDFEKYTSNNGLQKSYLAWREGAQIEVTIESAQVNSGEKAMRVDILAPNAQNDSTNGSIYHVLPINQRNWSNGSGIRFWVKNLSDQELLLSLNFKERFNEYWAVTQAGFFFLEPEPDLFQKMNIAYGNLPIPAGYQGFVVVPFLSFGVPDWNSAQGNEVMELARIESFAFGVTVRDVFPVSFVVDDISVITRADYPYLEIKGQDFIQVPATGEHREPFSAYLFDPSTNTAEQVDVLWEWQGQPDKAIQLDAQGWVTIPAGLPETNLKLKATYSTPQGVWVDDHALVLTLGEGASAIGSSDQEVPAAAAPVEVISDYEYLSRAFESWASENRPLFVILAVSLVLLVVLLLTAFQKRIK